MGIASDIRWRVETLEALGFELRKRREEKKLSLEKLARLTGISKPYLANIETARVPGPASEPKLKELEKALGFEEGVLVAAGDWLRTPESVRVLMRELEAAKETAASMGIKTDHDGQQPPTLAGDSPRLDTLPPQAALSPSRFAGDHPRRADGTIDLDAMVRVGGVQGDVPKNQSWGDDSGVAGVIKMAPVINKVAAGKAAEHGDLDYPAGVADAYVPVPAETDDGVSLKESFAAKVSGESMLPEYVEGDVVIVAPLEAHDGADCLVRLGAADNFATTIKRIFFVPDHSGQAVAIRLVPRNPAFAERVVELSEVTGIYPVVYRMTRVRG